MRTEHVCGNLTGLERAERYLLTQPARRVGTPGREYFSGPVNSQSSLHLELFMDLKDQFNAIRLRVFSVN